MRSSSGYIFLNNFIEFIFAEKLSLQLQPVFLDIVNESFKHSVPKGSETHFKVSFFIFSIRVETKFL